jgi:hypothetical protein
MQSINFNTVDGFYAGYELAIGNKQKKPIKWELRPGFLYTVSREVLNYQAKARFYNKGWDLQFSGGNQVRQFDYDHPMSPWSNTLWTLLANRNFLKEYETKFLNARYQQKITAAMGIDFIAEYNDRKRLENTTDIVFFDSKKLLYTSNDPEHLVGGPDVFNDHEAFVTDASWWIKPFWKYQVQRGTKRKDYSASPMLTLRYRKGWGEENHPFDFISADFEYKFPIGAGSLMSLNISGGQFVGENKPVYFHDFFHAPGNRLIATPVNPVSAFRMLDYYTYSTNDKYFYGLFNYQFRRFGLTQFNYFRRQGIRENVIFNTLLTKESQQYAEIGYAINYILRFMRIEFVTNWQDYQYQNFAVRFGIATDFQSLFGGL